MIAKYNEKLWNSVIEYKLHFSCSVNTEATYETEHRCALYTSFNSHTHTYIYIWQRF